MMNEKLIALDLGLVSPEDALRLRDAGVPQVSPYYWINPPCRQKKKKEHQHVDRWILHEMNGIEGSKKDPIAKKHYDMIEAEKRITAAYSTNELIQHLEAKTDKSEKEISLFTEAGGWTVQTPLGTFPDTTLNRALVMAILAAYGV